MRKMAYAIHFNVILASGKNRKNYKIIGQFYQFSRAELSLVILLLCVSYLLMQQLCQVCSYWKELIFTIDYPCQSSTNMLEVGDFTSQCQSLDSVLSVYSHIQFVCIVYAFEKYKVHKYQQAWLLLFSVLSYSLKVPYCS